MKFIDCIQILVKAGRGGDGIVSFMRASRQPKLGPDGGDGGTGGSVVLVGTKRENTLSSLRFRAIYQAEDGVRGGTKRCRGRCGEDLYIPVPLGTVAFDATTGMNLGELLEEGQELLVAKGGRHGLGNCHWVKPTHQAPEEFRPGGPGEEREVRLELKLLADVGLAGFPNAGKSTLLSAVSAARPKIADYPFTTLAPNLGVVDAGSDDIASRSFVMADVPGLIEGASEGRGLGHQFLRHLERTSVIVYVLDCLGTGELEPQDALKVLRREMEAFSPELARKQSVALLTKIDLVDKEALAKVTRLVAKDGYEVLHVSAATGKGVRELKRRLFDIVEGNRIANVDAATSNHIVFSPAPFRTGIETHGDLL